MKRRSILGGAAVLAAIGLAVPADGALRTPFLDMLVRKSAGNAQQSLKAFKKLLGHKHKVLKGMLQVRSTGLRQLVCSILQGDLRRLLIVMRRAKRKPAETLAMLRRNLTAWSKRLPPAVVDALESYGKPPGLTDFFKLVHQGDQAGWKLVTQVFKGELKPTAKALANQWEEMRPKLEEALGKFRTWATAKGLEGIRTALYQANLILQENRPGIVQIGAAKKAAKEPTKAAKEPTKAAKEPTKAAKEPTKAAKEPANEKTPPEPAETPPEAPAGIEPIPEPVPVPNS